MAKLPIYILPHQAVKILKSITVKPFISIKST